MHIHTFAVQCLLIHRFPNHINKKGINNKLLRRVSKTNFTNFYMYLFRCYKTYNRVRYQEGLNETYTELTSHHRRLILSIIFVWIDIFNTTY